MPAFLSDTELRLTRDDTETISVMHQVKLRSSIRKKLRLLKSDLIELYKNEEFKTDVQEVVDGIAELEKAGSGVEL